MFAKNNKMTAEGNRGAVSMPVKFSSVKSHKHQAGTEFHGRWCIYPKALAAAIPVENDPAIGNAYPAILQLAVTPLIKAKAIGCNFYEMPVGAPGAQKNKFIVVEWLLAGGDT